MAEVKSFFDKMYSASESELKAEKKGTTKKRLQRKFHSAFDDAEDKKIDAEQAIENARVNFVGYDINIVLAKRMEIARLEDLQLQIEAEYLFIFGEKM